MSKSEDISRLFSHLEHEPNGEYKEITKADEIEKSKSRWPILNKDNSEKIPVEKVSFLSSVEAPLPTKIENVEKNTNNKSHKVINTEKNLINIFNRIKGHDAPTEKGLVFKKLINK